MAGIPVPPLMPSSNLTYAIESQLLVNTDVIIVNNYQNNEIDSNYINVGGTILTNNSIVGLVDPVSNHDIVTKNYIDNFVISNLPGNNGEIFFNTNNILGTNDQLTFTTSSSLLFTPNLTSTNLRTNELTIKYSTVGTTSIQGTTTSYSLSLPTELGQPLQVLVSDSSGNLSFVSNQTPGSPNFAIQYSDGNNGFSGDSSFTFSNKTMTVPKIESSLLVSENLRTDNVELSGNNFNISLKGNDSFTTFKFSSNIGTTGYLVGSNGTQIDYFIENSNTITGGMDNSILFSGNGGFTTLAFESSTFLPNTSTVIIGTNPNYVYITNTSGNETYIMDVTDKTSPYINSTINYSGDLINEVINGDDILFILNGSTNDLYTFNVNDKANPVLLSTLNDPAIGYSTFKDNIIYTNGNSTYTRINVSDPSSPFVEYTTSLTNNGSITVTGPSNEYLYVCSNLSFETYDISSALNYITTSTFTDPLRQSAVGNNSNYLYLLTSSSIYVIDITIPLVPTTISFVTITYSNGIFVVGNNLYTCSNTSILDIYDISNPEVLILIFSQEIQGLLNYAVSDTQDYIYTTSLALYNDFNIYNLVQSSGSFNGSNKFLNNGNSLYVNSKITQNNGITFKNTGTISSLNDARYLFRYNLYIYIINSLGSFIYVYEAVDEINQLNIITTGIQDFKTAFMNGNYLYLLSKRELYVYDLSNSINPTLTFSMNVTALSPSNSPIDIDAIDFTIVNNFIYILFEQQPYINIYQIIGNDILISNIIYVSNKTDFPDGTKKITNDLINDPTHLYANTDYVLTIFDITTPTNLINVSTSMISNNIISKIIPDYPYLYCLTLYELLNYSIVDYISPTTLSSLPVGSTEMYNNGNSLYITGSVLNINYGLVIIDMQNILNPVIVNEITIGNTGFYLYLYNNILYTLFSSRFILYDVSNSFYPYQISEYSFISNPLNLLVFGEYGYISNYLTNKVLKYSLTSFEDLNKESISSIVMGGLGVEDISIKLATFNSFSGSFLIYGNVFNYLNIIYNEKNNIEQIMTTNIDEEYITGLCSLNGYIYLTGLDLLTLVYRPQLYIYSMGNELIRLSKIQITTYYPESFNTPFVYKNLLYVITKNKLSIYDNTNPQNLNVLGTLSENYMSADNNIIVSGSYLYVIAYHSFKININNPLNPILITFETNPTIGSGTYCNITNSGKYIYYGSYSKLTSLSINNLQQQGTYNSRSNTGIALSGSNLYTTRSEDDYDPTNPNNNSFNKIDINGINCLNVTCDNILTSMIDITSQLNVDIINTDSMSIKNLLCESISVNHNSLNVPDFTTTSLTINSSSFTLNITNSTLSANSFVLFTINNYKVNNNRKIIYDINSCSINLPPILTILSRTTGSFEFQIYTILALSGQLSINFLIV